MQLIHERLALANAVCAALDVAQGNYVDGVASAARDLLHRWIRGRYSLPRGEVETHASDGLDQMVVPAGGEERMVELHLATYVCESLASMYTADYASDYTHDRNGVSQALDHWRAKRPIDVTLWRRPLKDGPAISLPYKGQRLSETELAYVKKASAQRQAASWNEALKDDMTYGPRSGLRVFVGGVRVNDRWPLVWY
jgi:hypothetical protein